MYTCKDRMTRGFALFATLALVACALDSGAVDDADEVDAGSDSTDDELALPAHTSTLSRRVPNSASDAEEQSNGSYYFDSPVLELGEKTPGTSQQTGLRFTNITIPKGAKIVSAYLEFEAATNTSAPSSLTIHGIKVSDTHDFGAGNAAISTRRRTSAETQWSPSTWSRGNLYRSASLVSIVKEITSLSTWESGNAVGFILTGDGQRKASAYDGGTAPRLVVRYEPMAGISFPTCLTSSNPKTYSATKNVRIRDLVSSSQVSLAGKTIMGTGIALGIRNNGNDLCVSGGTLKTDAQDNSDWHNVFHSGRLFANLINSKRFTLERVAGDVAGDGLHIESNSSAITTPLHAENWKLAHSYFRHVGDDIVDNDMRAAGTIDDVLVDWAHTGIACRGHAQGFQRAPGAMTVKNTLFAIKPQKSSAGGADGYYSPFKWDTPNGLANGSRPEYRKPCKLALNNVTVYMARKPTSESGDRYVIATNGGGSIDPASFITECKNVTFLYGGTNYGKKSDGTKLEQLKQLERLQAQWGPSCFKIIQGQAAKNEWKARRNAWFSKHDLPGFEHIQAYRQDSTPL